MFFLESVRTASTALVSNKMRAALTTLGIVIGTSAVIAVVSVVQGLEHMITKELQGVGATYVMVMPHHGEQGPGVVTKQVRLTWDDGLALRDRVPSIRLITPLIAGSQALTFRERHHTSLVLGVNSDWQEVSNHAVDTGRFFSRIDLLHRTKVAVIGKKVVDELRLGDHPEGKEIAVGRLPVTVIGVMEERGQSLGQDADDLVFIPYDTALELFGQKAGDQIQLRLQVTSTEMVDPAKDAITRVLRERHKLGKGEDDDFQVLVQDEILKTVQSVLGNITAVIGAVVGIALLVGGIGIMNIMLVSVTERTREIGLRKAVGARRQDVLAQFLVEAVTLSLFGGVIGVAVGWGLGALVSSMLPGDWPPAHVPIWAIALSFGFSAFVGIAFGIYPAAKASRLDPIEALRHE